MTKPSKTRGVKGRPIPERSSGNTSVQRDLKDKKVTVMGLGLLGQGEAAVRFLVEQGAKVTVTDLKMKAELEPTLERLKGLPVRYVLGRHEEVDFTGADMVIRNPAVPWSSKYLQLARKHRVPVEMGIGLFFKFCPAPREKIIGITGTKGKTTTTLLIGEILKAAGLKVAVGGNIAGAAALSLLPEITPETYVVLELSSWQLEGLESHRKSPHIAVITNIYPDHLDRYSSMEDYVNAKETIFKYQKEGDFLILNRENEGSLRLGYEAPGQVMTFGSADLPPSLLDRLKLRGKHNHANIAAAMKVGEVMGLDRVAIKKAAVNFEGVEHRLEFVREVASRSLPRSRTWTKYSFAQQVQVSLRGLPRTEFLAVYRALLWYCGILVRGSLLSRFRSNVRACFAVSAFSLRSNVEGIKFYNDSAATTPEATIAALRSFEEPIVLICGGADKNLEFSSFARAIATANVKAAILLEGTATDKIEKALGKGKILGRFDDIEKAVRVSVGEAQAGDVVLLSPACASFGMFINEFDRGRRFKELVESR